MRASDGHHHLASSNVISFEKLELLFKGASDAGDRQGLEIVGQRYLDLLQELAAITEYQWRSGLPRNAVNGFMLSGPPGTGKTTIAKRLAYELGCRFQSEEEPPIVLAFIDGSEISRSRYGESEERIRDIFMHARAGFTAARQRSVLLFDDVESIFMARGSQHAKEWHFSQDSVFFHSIDDLDTSRCTIVLTSNRPDLIDDAIRDRFLTYEVNYPDVYTLVEMAERMPAIANLPDGDRTGVKEALTEAARQGSVRSIRDAQRFAMRYFVSRVLGKASLASFD